MSESSTIKLAVFLIFCCANQAMPHELDHRYSFNDSIPLYASKVGSIYNPSETYAYYNYPFCYSDNVKEKEQSFEETLNGDRLVISSYKLDYLVDKHSEVACSRNLSRKEVSQFRLAIEQVYYIQLYYDDLPVWIFFGEIFKKTKPNNHTYLIYDYIFFSVFYNKDRVIEIHASTYSILTVDLAEDKEVEIEFKYSVNWIDTDISYDRRMEKALLPYQLRAPWSALMASSLPLLILFGFASKIYLQKLKEDINKHAKDANFGEIREQTGWKSLHGDVFRHPMHKSLFAAFVGCGTQLVFLMLLIIMLAVLGIFPPFSRGALITTIVVIYGITSGIAGYSAISLYTQLEGTNWIKTLLLTTFIFLGPLLVTIIILNNMATTYRTTIALPLRTILGLIYIWFFVGLPLMLLGAIFGKYTGSRYRPPCRTNKCPREVPRQRWYRRIFPRMAIGGYIIFHVTYTELECVLATLWNVMIYNTYPFLLMVFIVLLVFTSLVAVNYTYIQLSFEDHQWWWRSFLNGGTGALYMFGYCVYYFYQRSNMSGVLQTTFFFGYMACLCYGLFLMLGAIAFYSSLFFVRRIYGAIKCE